MARKRTHKRTQRRTKRSPSAKPTKGKRPITPAVRARRTKANCYCSGWFWNINGGPHRRGSMASESYYLATGIVGCWFGHKPDYIVEMEAAAAADAKESNDDADNGSCPF